MAELDEIVGRHADIPFVLSDRISSAAGGTAADYEVVLFALTDLGLIAPSSPKSTLPGNDIALKAVTLIPEANITGNATNNFYWAIRQWRGGSAINQVNTTAPAITAGAGVVVTPANPAGIQVGSLLFISGGTGASETVLVTAIGNGTFTANFANSHSGAFTITSTQLALVNYNAPAVTETAYVPHQLTPLFSPILPGDVITLQRLSNNATGLASPSVGVMLEYSNVLYNRIRG